MFYLIGLAIFMLFFCLFNKDKKQTQPKTPEEKGEGDPKKTFYSRDELRTEYSGNGPSGKIYLACFDTVFDVSSSANFQPGGTYESFAGRDVSVACAYHSTDEKYLCQAYDRETTQFTIDQEQNMMMFYMQFCQKYPIKGKIGQVQKKDE